MSRATSVRPATADDIAAITTAYLQAWRAGYIGILDPAELEEQAQQRASYDWHGAITRPESVVFVAELEVVEAQARARRFYEREGWRLDQSIPPRSNGLVRLLHYRHDSKTP
jgi:hypothetical protein